MIAVLSRLARFTTITTGVVGTAAAYRYNQLMQRQAQQLPSGTLNLPTPTPDVIIIGGGVVGIAAAYTCATKGQRVLVIEPHTMAGQECTACAAGGMQRSNPVVNINTWLAVLKCSFGMGYQFFHIDWMKTLTDPFFIRWIFTFSTTSLLPGPDQATKQEEMLKFTQFAVDEMVKFMNRNMSRASGYNPTGSLSLGYAPPEEEKDTEKKASNPSQSTMNHEPNRKLRSTAEVLKVEPSLRFQENPPQWAKFEYRAAAASAERYTLELARQCTQHPSVTFLFNTTVRELTVEPAEDKASKPSIAALQTTAGVINVAPKTQVVVATGAWMPHLLATADLYAPVYPLKGYAISLWAKDILKESKGRIKATDLPSRVVADAFMYTSRLGDEIRITSIGEFSGWSTHPTPLVDEEFRREAARQFPQLSEFLPTAQTRCGHRPYVNDGLVLMGRCPELSNLLVSCGPGSNGWKMAMGSAVVIQGLAAGKTEAEMTAKLGFDVSAFGPANRVVYAPWFAKLCRARWNV